MSLSEILEARERRWQSKQKLARRFRACVLSLRLNIPGSDKNPPGAEEALTLLQAAFREAHAGELQRLRETRPILAPSARRGRTEAKQRTAAGLPRNAGFLHEIRAKGADGSCRLMVSPLPAFTLKRMAVRIENEHPLGRLADIDILTQTGKPVSRGDLGLPQRSCFLCGEAAALCRRRKSHSQAALMDFVASLLGRVGDI